jgi:formylglycine-generating enzyme required for sulfatase activity
LLLGGGAVLVLALIVGIWVATREPAKPQPPPKKTTPAKVFKPDLVAFPGGIYRMGRADEPQPNGEEDLAWAYAQWPMHTVTVLPFALDRTEVSNEEYAQFVQETDYPAPRGWNGNEPFAGTEQLPVVNVSYEDAVAFAKWRSERDGVTYRLPTEEEWEYAARNGGEAGVTNFPWGSEWTPDLANIQNSSGPKPVTAFPKGATKQGLLNMIGNVGEWTSTDASYYESNDKLELNPSQKDDKVVRGGSYVSQTTGPIQIRVTLRAFIDAKKKDDPTIGFRLARSL